MSDRSRRLFWLAYIERKELVMVAKSCMRGMMGRSVMLTQLRGASRPRGAPRRAIPAAQVNSAPHLMLLVLAKQHMESYSVAQHEQQHEEQVDVDGADGLLDCTASGSAWGRETGEHLADMQQQPRLQQHPADCCYMAPPCGITQLRTCFEESKARGGEYPGEVLKPVQTNDGFNSVSIRGQEVSSSQLVSAARTTTSLCRTLHSHHHACPPEEEKNALQ